MIEGSGSGAGSGRATQNSRNQLDVPGVLLEPALPDKEMLDEMDLAALLLHLPVHLVEAPPGVGAAGR